MDTRTFAELESDCVGTVYHDEERTTSDGTHYRFRIQRGMVSLCAYIGVPAGHPYWGKDYNDVELSCHGGLTFSTNEAEGGGGSIAPLPADYWWLGWDYAHSMDRPLGPMYLQMPAWLKWREWTVPLVLADAETTLREFEGAGAQA